MLTRPSFWILDPKLAREVLAPKFTIQDSDRDIAKVLPIWGRLFGQGLFMVSGDQWKRQHRIAARSFGSSNTRGFLPTVREVATRHVDHLWEPSQSQATGGDTTTTIIAPTDAFAPMALEVICSIAFGLEDPKVLERVTELTRIVSDVMNEKGVPSRNSCASSSLHFLSILLGDIVKEFSFFNREICFSTIFLAIFGPSRLGVCHLHLITFDFERRYVT